MTLSALQFARQSRHEAAASALDALAGAKAMTIEQAGKLFRRGLDIGSGSPMGGPSDVYRQALWVYRPVTVIAMTGGGVPLRLSRGQAAGTRQVGRFKHLRQGLASGRAAPIRGEKAATKAREGDLVEGGPLWDLLTRPEPNETWSRLMRRTLALMLLPPGRCLWHLDEMVGRRPQRIRVVAGSWTRPLTAGGHPDGELLGWEVRTPWGHRYSLALDEVVCWASLNPYRPHEGLSPAEPAALAIVSDYNASTYNAAMFANSAEPGGALKTQAAFNPDLDEQLRMAWRERHGGPARAKSPAVLWGGMEWQSIASTMADMQFDQGKRMARTEEVAAFGVSEVVAGFYSDANYGFAEQGREQFWQDTMMPLLDEFADGLQVHLVPRFEGGLDLWFDMEDVPIIQKMRLARIESVIPLAREGVPMGDLNDLYDLGLPDRPWYKTGFISAGMLPASEAASATATNPADEGPANNENLTAENAEGAEKKAVRLRLSREDAPSEKDGASSTESLKRRIWEAAFRPMEALARRGGAILRVHAVRIQEAVVAALKRNVYAPPATTLGIETRQWEPVIERLLFEVFRDPKRVGEFRGRIRSFLADGQTLGLRQALAQGGLSGDALTEAVRRITAYPALSEVLKRETVRVSSLLDSRTRRTLKTSLLDGMERGESISDLADRVTDVTGRSRAQALQDARNILGQVHGEARREGVREAGLTHKYWMHSRGEGKRRPAHVAAESAYPRERAIPEGEPFLVNGVALQFPRDFSAGHPEETVNCQCMCLYVRRQASGVGSPGTEAAETAVLEAAAKALEEAATLNPR